MLQTSMMESLRRAEKYGFNTRQILPPSAVTAPNVHSKGVVCLR
eukprot:gene904-531_t